MRQDGFDKWLVGLRRWRYCGESTCREGREGGLSSILHDEVTRLKGRVGTDVEVLRKDDGESASDVI